MVENENVMSLSFVDVLANGMGSIVVLCLIVTVLYQGMELTQQLAAQPTDPTDRIHQTTGQHRPLEKDPFVILVTNEDDQPLRASTAGCRWEYPDDVPAQPNGGSRFAALYLYRSPADQTIALSGLRVGARVVVRIWSREGMRPPRLEMIEAEGRIIVWPDPSEKVHP